MYKVRAELARIEESAPGKSPQEMALRRQQKQTIERTLRGGQDFIEKKWNDGWKGSPYSFSIELDGDFTGGVLDRLETATEIRKWVVDNYGVEPNARLELARYEIQEGAHGARARHFIHFNALTPILKK